MSTQPATNLETRSSQPDELSRVLTSGRRASRRTRRSRACSAPIGSGCREPGPATTRRAGAAMLQDAGRSAVAVSSMRFVVWAPIVGPEDAIVVITHTGETAYALAARALATTAASTW